jgi:transposase
MGKRLYEQAEHGKMNIIGVDVSKAKLDCAWLKTNNKIKAKIVNNTPEGWQQLVLWAQQNAGPEMGVLHFVMYDCMDAGGRAMQEQLPRA